MKYIRNHFLLSILFIVVSVTVSFAQNLNISGGHSASAMICKNGNVFTWGGNELVVGVSTVKGILGTGNNVDAYVATPEQVIMPVLALPIKQVDAGSGVHFLVLSCSGSVWAWGDNQGGQLGNPAYSDNLIASPIQVVKGEAPGDVNDYLTNVTYISGGNSESYALLQTGEVVAWGYNEYGQLGNGTKTTSNYPVYVKINATTQLKNVIKIESGDAATYALVDPDGDGVGTVYSWGSGNMSQLGQGTGIIESLYANVVVKENGAVLNNIVSISAGDCMCFAIDEDGYVWSWGHGAWGGLTGIGQFLDHSYAKQVIGGATGTKFIKAKAISAGQGFGMAVTLDGKAVAWGNNGATFGDGGNLGDGTSTLSGAPVYILTAANTPITNVIAISDGDTWGFITKTDNSIWTWGDNNVGQLGIGNTIRQPYAVTMNNPVTCANPDITPVIVMPDDFSTCVPFSYTINPGFLNNGNYIFTWYKDGALLFGENGETCTVNSVGTYKVVITYVGPVSPCGLQPTEGYVTITAYTPDFTVPTAQTFCTTYFTPRVDGSGIYNYYTDATGGTYLGTSYQNNPTFFSTSSVTNVSGSNYTVYVQEAGNVAGTVTPNAPVNAGSQIMNSLIAQQVVVYNDLYLDSLSFKIKPWIGTTTNSWQIKVYGQKIGAGGVSVPDFTHVIASSQAVTFSVTYAGTLVTIPVNILLSGSSMGEFYWIGFADCPDPVLLNLVNATYPYVDDVNGNIIQVTGYSEFGDLVNTKYGPFIDWHFHTLPQYCNRIPVVLTEDCTCNLPSDVIITSSDSDKLLCSNGTTILSSNSQLNVTDFDFTWYKGDINTGVIVAAPIVNTNMATYTVSYSNAGLYTLLVRDKQKPTATLCHKQANVTINTNQSPIVTIEPDVNLMNVAFSEKVPLIGTIQFVSMEPIVYLWSDNSTIFSGQGTPLVVTQPITQPKTISVSVTDANGCVGTDQITLVPQDIIFQIWHPCDSLTQIQPNEIVDGSLICLDKKNEICMGQSIHLVPQFISGETTALTYSWTDDDNNVISDDINLFVIPVKSINIYTLTVTNSAGYSNSATFLVMVNPNPIVTISVFPDYNGKFYIDDMLTINGNPSGGTTPWISHKWTTNATITNPNVQITQISSSTAQTIHLLYEIEDTKGCKAVSSRSIDIIAHDLINIIGETAYQESTILYSLDKSYPAGTIFIWTVTGGQIVGSSDGSTVQIYWPVATATGMVTVYVQQQNDVPYNIEKNVVVHENSTKIDSKNSKEITISPNPFLNKIKIQGIDSEFEYSFFDLTGKEILQGKSNKNSIIGLEPLSIGEYILVIKFENKIFTFKVIRK